MIIDLDVRVELLLLLVDFTEVLDVLDLLLDLLDDEAVTMTSFVEVYVESGGV